LVEMVRKTPGGRTYTFLRNGAAYGVKIRTTVIVKGTY